MWLRSWLFQFLVQFETQLWAICLWHFSVLSYIINQEIVYCYDDWKNQKRISWRCWDCLWLRSSFSKATKCYCPPREFQGKMKRSCHISKERNAKYFSTNVINFHVWNMIFLTVRTVWKVKKTGWSYSTCNETNLRTNTLLKCVNTTFLYEFDNFVCFCCTVCIGEHRGSTVWLSVSNVTVSWIVCVCY